MNNNQNNPLVSVIIPVYNGEAYVAEAIESVINQSYQPIEIIIVDDGSTDNSAKIIHAYKQVRYIYQSNQGVAQARNTGIAEAKGEFIAFLDQDDLWTPNKLTVQISYLQQHLELSYVLAKQQIFIEPGIERPNWVNPKYLSEDVPAYLVGALVARKSVFTEIGCFDYKYKYGNDSDFFFRASDAGLSMYILPETLLLKRIHNTNESHKVQEVTSDLLQLLRSSIQRKRQQKE